MTNPFKPGGPTGPVRLIGKAPMAYPHHKSQEREYRKTWENEQVCRKLDAVVEQGLNEIMKGMGRYMLIRSRRPGFVSPHAALFLRRNEKPEKVAEDLQADILELVDDCLPETAERLEAERDRLNSVSEVMET